MGVTGFEHPTESSRNNVGHDQRGAECGALCARNGLIDPRLVVIAESWPMLPEPIRAGILAMVRAAKGARQ